MIEKLKKFYYSKFYPWKYSKLVNDEAGVLFYVREKPMHEMQVQHNSRNEWTPISKTTWSSVPKLEDYHRQLFLDAVPESTTSK